jgi:hypothetical protein
VDHDHLRRPSGGHEQGMRRVRDVKAPARNSFDRRPPCPVPEQIQQPNWNATVDDGRTLHDIGV